MGSLVEAVHLVSNKGAASYCHLVSRWFFSLMAQTTVVAGLQVLGLVGSVSPAAHVTSALRQLHLLDPLLYRFALALRQRRRDGDRRAVSTGLRRRECGLHLAGEGAGVGNVISTVPMGSSREFVQVFPLVQLSSCPVFVPVKNVRFFALSVRRAKSRSPWK